MRSKAQHLIIVALVALLGISVGRISLLADPNVASEPSGEEAEATIPPNARSTPEGVDAELALAQEAAPSLRLTVPCGGDPWSVLDIPPEAGVAMGYSRPDAPAWHAREAWQRLERESDKALAALRRLEEDQPGVGFREASFLAWSEGWCDASWVCERFIPGESLDEYLEIMFAVVASADQIPYPTLQVCLQNLGQELPPGGIGPRERAALAALPAQHDEAAWDGVLRLRLASALGYLDDGQVLAAVAELERTPVSAQTADGALSRQRVALSALIGANQDDPIVRLPDRRWDGPSRR